MDTVIPLPCDAGLMVPEIFQPFGWVTAIVPPDPDMGIEMPVASAATELPKPMGMDVLTVVGETMKVAVAIGPLAITLAVRPYKRQVVEPPLPMQVTLFPAAVAAELGTTATLVTSAG